ncbi:MAG: S9 family peptidase [Flammeovirgaceae bacterium]|nr:S9 family peptidase [Flammeovirgaceae bacterium]
MHGGPIRQMLLGFHYSDYYINAYAFNQYLASQGYVVLSVNFRSGTGYGKDFRRAKNQGPRGASEYQDVVAAAKHLQALPQVNSEKIGLWGGSYGGYLTAMGLARSPEIFKAGVDLHGVHDWAFDGRELPPGGSWGITSQDMALAYKSSPISDLSKWTAPVLVVHGDDDRNVLFQQSTDLVEKLRDKNVPVEVLVLPDEVHGFLRYESWKRVFESAKDFFDRTLK